MDKNNKSNSGSRENIARILSYWVPIASGILAICAITFAAIILPDDRGMAIDILKYTFTALLPLWGTWLGTVLAYYFSKDNFESANENVNRLVSTVTSVSEKLQSIKVKEVMIPMDNSVTKLELDPGDNPENIKVKDAINILDKENKNRLPVLKSKTLVYIIHSSIFDKYVRKKIISTSNQDISGDTIKDMLESGDEQIRKSILNGAGFIKEDGNLLDAKRKMDESVYCNDVFVTKNGLPNGIVTGWITDKIVNENAKV